MHVVEDRLRTIAVSRAIENGQRFGASWAAEWSVCEMLSSLKAKAAVLCPESLFSSRRGIVPDNTPQRTMTAHGVCGDDGEWIRCHLVMNKVSAEA